MEDKKYTLTFYLDNPKEEHPDMPWESPFKVKAGRTEPPVLPVGRNRKDSRRFRRVDHRRDQWQKESPARMGLQRTRSGETKGSKLVLVACSAVAVGVIMGLMVLSLFAQEQPVQTGAGSSQSHTIQGKDGREDTLLLPAGFIEDGRLHLPSRSYFAVQAGAFSSRESAMKARDEWHLNGFSAAVFSMDDAHRLYVALALDEQEGRALSQVLSKTGETTYLRPHQTRNVQLDVGDAAKEMDPLPAFLALADQLFNRLLKGTVSALSQENDTVPEREWQAAEEMHRQLLLDGQQLLNRLESGPLSQSVERLMQEATAAVSALNAYRSYPASHYAWQIQQAGLNYLLLYEALLGQLEETSGLN